MNAENDEDIYSIIEAEDGTIIHTLNGFAISWTPKEKVNEQ